MRHIGLFVLTFFSTLLVGAELITGKVFFTYGFEVDPEFVLSFAELHIGLPYALGFLAFLTFHEFGHYFVAVYHKVKTSLPYYIPIYIPFVLNIGSLGAVIRLKEIPKSTRQFFDIGISGPLAGFVISVGLLFHGLTHLPDKETYILNIHPDYAETFGGVPDTEMMKAYLASFDTKAQDSLSQQKPFVYFVGSSMLMDWMMEHIPDDPEQVPPPFEIMHYPFLFVGFITLFFTALNLLPMGQLDGGHIVYGMFGQKTAGYIARIAAITLLFFGGTGFASFQDGGIGLLNIAIYLLFLVFICRSLLYSKEPSHLIALSLTIFVIQLGMKWLFPEIQPNLIWLIYAFLVVRIVGIDHPPAAHEHRVNTLRQGLGWLAIVIFILCFTPNPVWMEGM